MLPAEAEWIRARLAELELAPGATVVDVGSKSESYRCLIQPYIEHEVFRPLREGGVRIVHIDGEAQPGVDHVVDLTLPGELPDQLRAAFDVAICASVLPHVSDRGAAIRSLAAVTRPGGHAIVAVPNKYPRTPDPIDTGYRPAPDELARDLGPDFEVERKELIESAHNNLFIPDGPAYKLAHWTARKIAARVIRRQRMPSRCLVAAVVARRVAP